MPGDATPSMGYSPIHKKDHNRSSPITWRPRKRDRTFIFLVLCLGAYLIWPVHFDTGLAPGPLQPTNLDVSSKHAPLIRDTWQKKWHETRYLFVLYLPDGQMTLMGVAIPIRRSITMLTVSSPLKPTR